MQLLFRALVTVSIHASRFLIPRSTYEQQRTWCLEPRDTVEPQARAIESRIKPLLNHGTRKGSLGNPWTTPVGRKALPWHPVIKGPFLRFSAQLRNMERTRVDS